jgi:hypothetical protein
LKLNIKDNNCFPDNVGGNEASPVLVVGRGLLHLGLDGLKVSRHPRAARSHQQKSVLFVAIR